MKLKKFAAAVITIACTLAISMSAFAGWREGPGGTKYYQNDDGTTVISAWFQDTDGKWYYFDEYGIMMTNATTPDGYQVGADGAWIDGSAAAAKAVGLIKTDKTASDQKQSMSYSDAKSLARDLKDGFSGVYDLAYYQASVLNGYQEVVVVYNMESNSIDATYSKSNYTARLPYDGTVRANTVTGDPASNTETLTVFSDVVNTLYFYSANCIYDPDLDEYCWAH
ncbi:MAG: hypothetical protein Q4E57_08415 [Eubacteriales bacterium]|nr:hypothetical protein [Eubacteriales bacterium]